MSQSPVLLFIALKVGQQPTGSVPMKANFRAPNLYILLIQKNKQVISNYTALAQFIYVNHVTFSCPSSVDINKLTYFDIPVPL